MHGKLTVQGQSPDTSKPGTQGDKIRFHPDKWGVQGSPSSKNFNWDGTSEIKGATRVRNTHVCSIVRFPHENLHTVDHSESRTGVWCSALVIGAIGSYGGL